jgi:hypothetical protein
MHTCPECGQACTCNGDIDDIMFEDSARSRACRHWEECNDDYPEDWFEEDDDGA